MYPDLEDLNYNQIKGYGVILDVMAYDLPQDLKDTYDQVTATDEFNEQFNGMWNNSIAKDTAVQVVPLTKCVAFDYIIYLANATADITHKQANKYLEDFIQELFQRTSAQLQANNHPIKNLPSLTTALVKLVPGLADVYEYVY